MLWQTIFGSPKQGILPTTRFMPAEEQTEPHPILLELSPVVLAKRPKREQDWNHLTSTSHGRVAVPHT
jgi:hypothetical protein